MAATAKLSSLCSIVAFATLLSGCATTKYVDDQLYQTSELMQVKMDSMRENLESSTSDISNLLEQVDTRHTSSTKQLTRDLEDLTTRFDETVVKLRQRISDLDSDLADVRTRASRAERDMEDMRNQTNVRFDNVESSLEETRTRLIADLEEGLSEMEQELTQQAGALRSEIEVVSIESETAREDIQRIAAILRTGILRQLEIVSEQYLALQGATETLTEIVGTSLEGEPIVRTADLLEEAAEAHKQAVETGELADYKAALDGYIQVTQLDPDQVTANYNSASILLHLDQANDAIPYLERVLESDREGLYTSRVRQVLNEIQSQ